MGEPDCFLCQVAGYRSCDRCGGPVMVVDDDDQADEDVCEYCRLEETGLE